MDRLGLLLVEAGRLQSFDNFVRIKASHVVLFQGNGSVASHPLTRLNNAAARKQTGRCHLIGRRIRRDRNGLARRHATFRPSIQ